jgi:hypothetical protein
MKNWIIALIVGLLAIGAGLDLASAQRLKPPGSGTTDEPTAGGGGSGGGGGGRGIRPGGGGSGGRGDTPSRRGGGGSDDDDDGPDGGGDGRGGGEGRGGRSGGGAEKWGAIAYTALGYYVTIWNRPSKAEAERIALRQCSRRRRGCRAVGVPSNLCAGMASYSVGRYRGAFVAGGADPDQAEQAALKNCRDEPRSRGRCRYRGGVCGDGRGERG